MTAPAMISTMPILRQAVSFSLSTTTAMTAVVSGSTPCVNALAYATGAKARPAPTVSV